ncbi:MAG: hypothetical protein C0613_08460 [Desulfobulbaceae bacterium]|nr:MAG: hypothetical protein C0613_08460 [Desulfobulbaceae bacterium]
MSKAKILYKPLPSTQDTARQILDDVLTVHAAVGASMCVPRAEVEECLRTIQRLARRLLTPGTHADPSPAACLTGFVGRLERGERVPQSEIRLTLVAVEVAAAKLRHYTKAATEVGNGMDTPAA